jgi:hypothetical protein
MQDRALNDCERCIIDIFHRAWVQRQIADNPQLFGGKNPDDVLRYVLGASVRTLDRNNVIDNDFRVMAAAGAFVARTAAAMTVPQNLNSRDPQPSTIFFRAADRRIPCHLDNYRGGQPTDQQIEDTALMGHELVHSSQIALLGGKGFLELYEQQAKGLREAGLDPLKTPFFMGLEMQGYAFERALRDFLKNNARRFADVCDQKGKAGYEGLRDALGKEFMMLYQRYLSSLEQEKQDALKGGKKMY